MKTVSPFSVNQGAPGTGRNAGRRGGVGWGLSTMD